jgi:uncharacterized protein
MKHTLHPENLFRPFLILVILTGLQFTSHPLQGQTDSIPLQVMSDGVLLRGNILKPAGHTGKLPALIFLVGSGEPSTVQRYSSFIRYFFDEVLPGEGFALVYFDKRGVGQSDGVWYETTFEQRALDARNVALEIQKSAFIDGEKIFLAGHSQGGWIVQVALALYPELFAGGISMAGPTFGVRRQLVNDYTSRYICEKGFSEERAEKRATRRVNRELFLVSLLGRKGNLRQLKIIAPFEPRSYLQSIHRPILFLFAENDPLVSPRWSMDALEQHFPGGLPAHMEVYLAPGQEHAFRVAPPCYTGPMRDVPYSGSTREVVREWLVGRR